MISGSARSANCEKSRFVRQAFQLQAERAQLQSAWQAYAALTQEAVRTGNKVVMEQAVAAAGPADHPVWNKKVQSCSNTPRGYERTRYRQSAAGPRQAQLSAQ